MIAPREDGQGCVRGSQAEIERIYKARRFCRDYRAARKSAAPRLVPILWRAGLLFMLASGALIVHAAFRPDPGLQWLVIWLGLGVSLLGPIALRIACELAMTAFDFRDYLRQRDGEWT
ncbi:MAG: hypothetical protein ACNS61_17040 [Candidatus Wenzhouxiangella sp. M2_3B_020]